MTAIVTAIEISAKPPGGGAATIIRAGTAHGIGLRDGEREDFPALLLAHPTFEFGIFAAGRLDGPTVTDFGSLTLNNTGSRFDALEGLVGGHWTVTAWELTIEGDDALMEVLPLGDLDAIDPVFSGSCGTPRRSLSAFEIPLRSPLRGFDRPLETDTFPGTNDGTEGDRGEAALANQVRPTTLGYCLHVPAPASNAPAHRHQVNDGPIEEIVDAYLNGDTAAHTTSLATGIYTYSVNPADLVRSADVRGDKTGGVYRSTAGDLIALLATTRAGVASVDAADLATVNASCPEEVGFFAATRTTARAAADYLARGGKVYYLTDPLGVLRMGVLSAPAGPPVVELEKAHLQRIVDDGDLEIVPIAQHASIEEADPASLGDDGGLPIWRVVVRGRRHWVGGLAANQIAQILDADTKEELRQEWREAVAEAPEVKVAFPDAAQIVIETGFTDLAHMQAAANLELAIRRWPQQLVRIRTADRYLAPWLLGKTVSLKHPRYGLSAAPLFRVMRRMRQAGSSTLDLWRPVVTP